MHGLNFVLFSRHDMKIDFHDASDITQMIRTHRVAPQKPGAMCTPSVTSILYVDESKFPCEVRWLDCRKQVPKPGSYVTHTQQDNIWDICSLYHEGAQIVVGTRGVKVMYAYNTSIDKCEWTLKDKLGEKEKVTSESLTTDGFGNLYATDFLNSAIIKISANGVYLGTVIKAGEQGLGKPKCISWHNGEQCLLVAFEQNKYYRISKVQTASYQLNQSITSAVLSATKILDTHSANNVPLNSSSTAPNDLMYSNSSTAASLQLLRQNVTQTETGNVTFSDNSTMKDLVINTKNTIASQLNTVQQNSQEKKGHSNVKNTAGESAYRHEGNGYF